jgi:hypothetical protein
MSDTTKTQCKSCGRVVIAVAAARREGLCRPCHRELNLSDAEKRERQIFDTIDSIIEPFTSYRNALAALDNHPAGYSLCFAFHHVHSEIFNGGVSQLYSNSSWRLILEAIRAAEAAQAIPVSDTLREVVYYYHLKGRSKLKRQLDDDYFARMDSNWGKSISQLDDQYFDQEEFAIRVIPTLCADREDLFAALNDG